MRLAWSHIGLAQTQWEKPPSVVRAQEADNNAGKAAAWTRVWSGHAARGRSGKRRTATPPTGVGPPPPTPGLTPSLPTCPLTVRGYFLSKITHTQTLPLSPSISVPETMMGILFSFPPFSRAQLARSRAQGQQTRTGGSQVGTKNLHDCQWTEGPARLDHKAQTGRPRRGSITPSLSTSVCVTTLLPTGAMDSTSSSVWPEDLHITIFVYSYSKCGRSLSLMFFCYYINFEILFGCRFLLFFGVCGCTVLYLLAVVSESFYKSICMYNPFIFYFFIIILLCVV